MARLSVLLLALVVGCSFYKEEVSAAVNRSKKVSDSFSFEYDPTLLTTSVHIVFRTGSIEDPKDKRGLANILGEMLLRGTKKRSREAFQSAVERIGGRVVVGVSNDSVVVTGTVIKESTTQLLSLLQEAVTQPAFEKKEFASLKSEIVAGIAHAKNSNGRLAGLALRQAMFAGTAFEQPDSGNLSTLKSISHKDLASFYPRLIHSDGILIGVSSSIADKKLRPVLEALVKKLPKGTSTAYKSVPLQVPKTDELIVVHKPKTSTGSILMGQRGLTANDPARYPLGMGNFSFGGEPLVSRLFKTIRSELGWTYAIRTSYSTLGSLSKQEGIFSISTTPTIEFTAKTLLKIRSMWKEYLDRGLTKDELSLAKSSLVNSYPFEFDSADKRLSKKLYEKMYDVPILTPDQYKKTIEAIDNDQIKAALKKLHSAAGWTITIVADAAVLEKQLLEEQKALPQSQRLKIAKRLTPDSLIE